MPVDIASTGPNTATVSLSYLNPKLADIAPLTTVPVSLHLQFGFTGTRHTDDSYPLLLDATPPGISIVSPANGDRVVLSEPTDVLLQSFDRYGVERVEVQINGGGYQEAIPPTRFRFTPLDETPVLIEARAVD